MIIDCISDLHGHYPKLMRGDLLIIAGDLTGRDKFPEYCYTFQWIARSNYKKKILVAGNHDNLIQSDDWFCKMTIDFEYLCDSGTEFEGLKIWGSPWTKTFPGMNPHCKAFTFDTDEELEEKWKLIPDDIDILITHSPPNGYFDYVLRAQNCGSISLRNHVMNRIKPKLHVFGHIHEWGGQILDTNVTKFVNASYVDEDYDPVNKPIRVVL